MQSQLILTTLAKHLVKCVPSTVIVDCDIQNIIYIIFLKCQMLLSLFSV